MLCAKSTFQGLEYFFEGVTGSLLVREAKKQKRKNTYPEGVSDEYLSLVHNPFLLKARPKPAVPERIGWGVKLYARV